MLRLLLKFILAIIVIVAIAAFFFGYRWASPGPGRAESTAERPVGTGGRTTIDTSRARETGAEIGERVATGVSRAEDALSDASVTAKIKSKIALDDTMKGTQVSVDTDGATVTLTGRVASAEQKARALQLARETAGVTAVNDRIRIE